MTTRHVLLTGGSGVLGREIVPRLLREHPAATITLLLRPKGAASVADRLAEIRNYLLVGHPEADLTRIRAVAGDVSWPDLGLRGNDRERLRRAVTHVVHGAATTRLDEEPLRTRRINVEGTRRAAAFAASCPGLRLFCHVSTAYVCGDREGWILEGDLQEGQRFLNAYEASKFEAERLVRKLMSELPITVVRPSIIVGDSHSGRISSFGSLYAPLFHIARGAVRDIPCPADAELDLVPVDYVADCLVRLLDRPEAVGATHHLVAGRGRRTSVQRLFTEAIRIAGGHPERALRFGRRPEPSDRLDIFFAYPRHSREFCDTATRVHLGAGAPVHPYPARFLEPMFTFCRDARWGRGALPEEARSCHAKLA